MEVRPLVIYLNSMQKKIQQSPTYSLLKLGGNVREGIAIIQAVITAFVAIVAIIVSIRVQPIVDSIRTLDTKVEAIDSITNEYRNDIKQIMAELFTIKGEIKRIK